MAKHLSPLTTFAAHPTGVRFETQEEKEKVVLFLRQHIIVNLPWVLLTFVLLIAPTVIFPKIIAATSISFSLPVGYYIVGTIFWYIATAGFIMANFLSWFFNIYIVTNQRVVDIDFYNLLYKHFAEADLTKIQDISYTSGGILSAMFNYGRVSVQTAGEMPNLEFDRVPYPEKVVMTIRSLIPHGGSGV